MVLDLSTDDDDVVRVGAGGGWSFAVAYGLGDGGAGWPRSPERRGGDPSGSVPDHPPAMFSYARDGADVPVGFGIGEEVWRWGDQPNLLLPELIVGWCVVPGRRVSTIGGRAYRDRDRHTLALIEARIRSHPPRDEVEKQRLPAFVIG